MLQLGVRFYDVALGRFTQPDSVFALDAYAYTWDRPTQFVDANGKSPVDIGKGVVKWICKLFPNLWGCKNIWKPADDAMEKIKKCVEGFDCTKCAANLIDDARLCNSQQPDGDGDDASITQNPLQAKMDCMAKLREKYKGQPYLVQCLTKCANIPIKMLGGTSPGRL